MSNFKIIRALQNYKEDKDYYFSVDEYQYQIIIDQNIHDKSRKQFILRKFIGIVGSTISGLIYDTEDFRIYYCSIDVDLDLIHLDEPLENYDDTELLYHIRQLSDNKIIRDPNLLSKIKEIL